MGTVLSHMTMSIDGYIADPDDGIDGLFDWYAAGEVAVSSANPDIAFTVDPASAEVLRGIIDRAGALVCGRRLFDITDGWGDNHPIGAPVVVVTHTPPTDVSRWPRTRFAADVASAIATATQLAGDRDVIVSSASIASQALDLGLLDAVAVSLAPIVLGSGIPYLAHLTHAPHRLDDPVVVTGERATHLTFRVQRN